ncbi:hypothetical protein ACX8XN_19525 [Calditrichota bacterium GD2]
MRSILILVFFTLIGCQYPMMNEDDDFSDIYPTPDYLRVISIGKHALKLEWSPMYGRYSDSFFQIERSDGDTAFVVLDERVTHNYFFDYSVDPAKQYTYRLKAYNSWGESNFYYVRVKYDLFHQLKTAIDFPTTQKLKMARSGKMFAASSENLLMVWDTQTLQPVREFSENNVYIGDFEFSALGRKMIYTSDSIVKGVHLPDGETLFTFATKNKVAALAASSDLSRIMIATSVDTGKSFSFDLIMYQPDGRLLWQKSNTGIVYDLLFTHDDKEVIAMHYGKIRIFSARDGSLIMESGSEGDFYHSPALNYEGSALLFLRGNINGKYLNVLDLQSKHIEEYYLRESYHNSIVSFVQMGNTDTLIYGDGNYIRFIAMGTERAFYSFAATLNQIRYVIYSPLTGDLYCQAPGEPIYVYGATKSEQWRAY